MIAFAPPSDDATLDPDTERMIRVAAGDRGAFDELVRRHFSSTVRIISSMMGSCCQSEDLAQDVFLRVYRSRSRYLPTAKFSTWLGTIARNVVLNAKRSRSRARVYATRFVEDGASIQFENCATITPTFEIDIVEELDRQEIVLIVQNALRHLPIRQQKAIELVHFRGMSYESAAREMGTTNKAVKSLLGRGRLTLEDLLTTDYETRYATC